MDDDKVFKYKDYEEKLIPLVAAKMEKLNIKDPKGFTMGGITYHFIQNAFGESASVNLGGENLPVLAVVANSTYAIYYFALRPLMNELQAKEKEEADKKAAAKAYSEGIANSLRQSKTRRKNNGN